MKVLKPLESLRFFENNLPEFLLKDNTTKNMVADLTTALQDPARESFHANVLLKGKELIKHIITRSIEYLSNETNSPKDRSHTSLSLGVPVWSSIYNRNGGI